MTYIDELIKAGGNVYEVGGTVRDRFLKRKTKDRDYLVTKLTINKISNILKKFGNVTLVGKSFGILKFYPKNEPNQIIDIAIPRKEKSTGSGHREFEVEFDPNLPVEADLSRRDFTVNAMALDVNSETLIDPFNGMEDLENGVLKQVFEKAFIEDPLRLLRAVQFSARLNLKIDKKTYNSMATNAALIKTVSAERIIEEIRKLFLASKPSIGIRLMSETGILGHLMPQLEATKGIAQAKQKNDDVFNHTMKVLDATRDDPEIDNSGDLELMFAALLHDIGKSKTIKTLPDDNRTVFYGHQIVSARMATKFLKRFKSTIINVDPAIVSKLIENHMFETKSFFAEKAIRRFISKLGKDLILKLIDLRIADNRGGKYPKGIKGVLKLKNKIIEEINRKPPFGAKDLALNGHDIMNLGIKEGPSIGIMLGKLVDIVLDEPELNTKESLTKAVNELMTSDQ